MHRPERGSTMVVMMLVMLVMSSLTMIAAASAMSALRASRAQRGNERAVNLAEAGASRALSLLSTSSSYSNDESLGEDPTREQVIAAASTITAETAPEGEFTWVVTEGRSAAYGIGYVPSRDSPDADVKVVRVDYEIVESAASYGMLTEGDLAVGGTTVVSGLGGSVHSNGDLSLAGSAWINGAASATGTATAEPGAGAGGGLHPGMPSQPTNVGGALDYRFLATYEMCPDSTVRAAAQTVCTGSIVGWGTLLGWEGWTFDAVTGWTMAGTSSVDGGFYVHNANATISGSVGSATTPWLATIVVGGTELAGSLTSGDLTISGNAVVRPFQEGVLGVADRDVSVSGSTTTLEGLLVAGEHASLTGNGSITGQLITGGASDTFGSPVSSNVINDVAVQASFGGPVAFGGVEVTRWSQL